MNVIKTLIVDDSADFRNRLRRFLDEQKEIEVVGEAGDGHEAVEMAKALEPDLILMDVRMPRMNGLQAMIKIGNIEKTKVIVLSGFDLHEYRKAAKEMGASAYVIKKSMVDKLMPAIRKTFKEL